MLALMMMVGPVGMDGSDKVLSTDRDAKKEITSKERSVGAHRKWITRYAKDYTTKVDQYKIYKSMEASKEVYQVWEKIQEQQKQIGTLLQELCELNVEKEAEYIQQEGAVEVEVDNLEKLMADATKEVATAMSTGTQAGNFTQQSATGPPPIRKLEVKLTNFRADAAEQWFEETERALGAANVISDVEKIVCIQRYIPENVREAKRSLFSGRNYQAVRDAVIKAVEKTEEEKFKAFLAIQLGDRKPSEAWAELTKLMPVDAQEFQDLVMKQKFLAMVGTDLAQHLTDDTLTLARGLDTEDIERYVQKVDKLYASKKPRAAVHSVKKDMDSKETEVSEVKNKRESEKQKGNRRRRDNRSDSSKRRGNYKDRMCKLHDRFGEKAYSCDKPDECPMAKLTTKRPEKPEKK